MFNNYFVFEVSSYNSESLFLKLKSNKISIISIKKVDEYKYILFLKPKFEKIITSIFKDGRIISKHGFYYILKNQFVKMTTVISLLFGITSFVYFMNHLYSIEIIGTNYMINESIEKILNNNKIYKFSSIPNENKLNKIKEIILDEYDGIEKIEFNVKGTNLIIFYTLKEDEIINDNRSGKYYASKDGVISYIDIKRGNFVCSINQYVQKDELLIDDYLYLNDEKIYVGAHGKVYAYTWSIVEYTCNSLSSEVDSFFYMKTVCRNKLSSKFIDDEKIIEENILSFLYDENNSFIKIHFTVLENIAFFNV